MVGIHMPDTYVTAIELSTLDHTTCTRYKCTCGHVIAGHLAWCPIIDHITNYIAQLICHTVGPIFG